MSASAKASRSKTTAAPTPVNPRLVALLDELATGEGFGPSRLPGVRFMRSTQHVPRSPVAYEPGIAIVAQGRKSGYLGERSFFYGANHYLVLSVPMPFECETHGSPEEPLLGLFVGVTPQTVADLLLQMEPGSRKFGPPRAIESAPLDVSLADAAMRLLETLRAEDDARILGPQIVREITYRVLLGELGGNLRELAAPHTHFGQISRVLHRLHADYARAHDMETLAREAGMSVSTFHAHFKAVTDSSPLQYLKTIRLHKARMLMVHEGVNAAGAASKVGYESPSQFSREFKRLFGDGPAAVAAHLRKQMMRLA